MFSFLNLFKHLYNNIFNFYKTDYIINNKLDNINLHDRIKLFELDNIKNFYLTYSNPIIIPIIAIYPRNNNYINIINEISKYFNTIIIIFSINPLFPINFDYITNLSKNIHIHLIEVNNIGFDFYKYFIGINYIINKFKFDRILLINDSFIFTRSIYDFIDYIKYSHNYFNLIGLNNSYEIKLHIQSFIISFDINICNEFLKYHKKHFNINHTLNDIINIFEIGFTNYIINNNKYKTDSFYYITSNNNPYLDPEINNLKKLYSYPIEKTKKE